MSPFSGIWKGTPPHSLLLLAVFSLFLRSPIAHSQNQSNPTTDPSEDIVNSIFRKLNVRAPTQWNVSGELCTGSAIDSMDLQSLNPGIKCDCSDKNGTLCHITALRLFAMDLLGVPDELWNLTFLTNLQNYFTGPLPAAISRLTRLQNLNLRFNALSGKLPKELGLLTDLPVLYFDSSGISGVIPPSLQGYKTSLSWGSDTQLTGQIPDFIGNWSQLCVLRLQGNSFHGIIPSSFSNLTSLKDLRISDLTNGNDSCSLEFLQDMKSLNTLVLRNNNVSGPIPSYIGELQNLQRLDLSFNSFSGLISESLFNIKNLTHIFLGDNKLTGSLPQLKSSNLPNLDMSFNELSGSFPSWVNEQNLQLNLVANNFTQSDSNRLHCLQRNFPCNRGSPIYSNLSIKCGGPALSSADGVKYEADNQTNGPATFYVTSSRNWAVSNAGFPADGPNPKYAFISSAPIANTLDPEIFQYARVLVGSLRYFGLGMENGNYTVNLQFAEPDILDTVTWRSLGKRAFDIYIQGNLVEKDFDIKREADGHSLTSVQRTFSAIVSENYLEIHLFWAGKGTCCVQVHADLLFLLLVPPQISFPLLVPRLPTGEEESQWFDCWYYCSHHHYKLSVRICFVLFDLGKKTNKYLRKLSSLCLLLISEFLGMDARPYTFSYAELRAGTNDFNPANKVGEGGFDTVFKGNLYDWRDVAVKLLSVVSNQCKAVSFQLCSTLLVKLYGCCIKGDKRLLVYEYLENKSLDQALFRTESLLLDWSRRFDVCLGVARGLAYLHEESRVRIVHRDVKASNILLDSDLSPKISDFGLAKLYDDKMTHVSTRVAGTIGYLAPEYAMRGHLTEKADVFGFGVVALEIVSGRPNSETSLDEDKIHLLDWAWNLHENERDIELVDPRLTEFDENEVKRVISVALLCTLTSPSLRPPMSRVVAMLCGDIEVTSTISKPGYLTDWKFMQMRLAPMHKTSPDDNHYKRNATLEEGMEGNSKLL
ncbi:OLC1v1008633C1 [Oldenlandia corymbosa var. corymbosa]|uniref:non-specific serine/threonine protein kinase n=1 Tax=Oldenlandia corymbosa var. corymbosa TaxID=529605 RepID=A0AAV1DPJ2_OLDCO|nr:OLC1v1008633C1 [Oldenlandia corymbosa var. corymbosa]